jgi:hypothetical protein
MSDSAQTTSLVNTDSGSSQTGFVWGAEAIGRIIGRTERQMHHLLRKGAIKSAQKRGHQYVAYIPALKREFGAE